MAAGNLSGDALHHVGFHLRNNQTANATEAHRQRNRSQLATSSRRSILQSAPGRCLLRSCSNHPDTEGKHQAQNHRATTPAASCTRSHNFNPDGPDPLLNLLPTCPKGSDDIQSPALLQRTTDGILYRVVALLVTKGFRAVLKPRSRKHTLGDASRRTQVQRKGEMPARLRAYRIRYSLSVVPTKYSSTGIRIERILVL